MQQAYESYNYGGQQQQQQAPQQQQQQQQKVNDFQSQAPKDALAGPTGPSAAVPQPAVTASVAPAPPVQQPPPPVVSL